MAALVVVLLGVLGFAIGWAVFGDPAGGVVATGAALVFGGLAGVGTYFAGDCLVLAVSGAKEVDEASAPQLMNVVREMAIAANVPMPRVYLIDDTAPNAFATGRDPAHAIDRRSRPASSTSSIARSSRASSATSCRTSGTSTSASRSSSG